MESTIQQLQARYEQAKAENPKSRIRDLANILGVSEAQLVALNTGTTVTRLEGDFKELLKAVHTMGYVMALTRNDNVVHERKGVYNNVSFEGPVGLVLDLDIDLRLFMMHWKFGFAVQEADRKSLQFFDKSGEAVHKIYLTDRSDVAAFEAIVAQFKAADQNPEVVTEAYPVEAAELADSAIDVAAFRESWLNLKDTHEFYGLLKRHQLTREQALRLAPEGYAIKIDNTAVQQVFEAAAADQTPIMIFVGNRGCIQIHTGTVTKLVTMGPWFNVMDPELNMHLREDRINSSWIVKKPSVDGVVTALEIFDEKGEMIAQFFGKRKPGNPELEEWRAIVQNVVNKQAHATV
jgi:putative hemin transport protein